jgi:short-subunit dehydrogenase
MTYVIVGASTGLGRALSEKFASENNDLIIISSDIRDLDALKYDLQNRFKVKICSISMFFEKHLDFDELDKAVLKMSPIDGILMPIGFSDHSDNPYIDEKKIIELFNINLINVCVFINHFLKTLTKKKSTIIGFGSISAIRGRSRNSTYSSAKRGLESYFESLRHSELDSKIIIQFYVLGYLDTNLTFGESLVGFKPASVWNLADTIYENRFDDFGKNTFPRYWKLVTLLLPLLPWSLFKKIKF